MNIEHRTSNIEHRMLRRGASFQVAQLTVTALLPTKRRRSLRCSMFGVGCSMLSAAGIAFAQVPDAPAPAASAPPPAATAPTAAPKSQGGFLGKDVPTLDPGTEILTWDGKNWNVNNNRIFQARF